MKNWTRLLSMLLTIALTTTSFGGVAMAEDVLQPTVQVVRISGGDESRAALTEITLSETELSLKAGETAKLTATANEGAELGEAVWSSDQEAVATVEDGEVKAVAEGEANITVSSGDISAVCKVTVTAANVELAAITLSETEVTVEAGKAVTLTATANEGAELGEVVWASDKEEVATVEDGVVTAVAAGEATITATVGEISAACKVIVTAAAVELTAITLDQSDAKLLVGETVTLTATANEGAELGEVEWTSDKEAVATVENGVVKAIGAGEATITASVGEISATCKVTVHNLLTVITLDKTTAEMLVGETITLTVTANEGAELGNVVWTSNNEAIATVENGEVKAISDGEATITARCGKLIATCDVTVHNALTAITLDQTSAKLLVGETVTLTATANEGAELGEVEWTSDKEAVATVENGVVKAIGAGEATITAAVGEISASCKVTVLNPLTAIILDKTTAEMLVGETITLTVTANEGAELGNVVWTSNNEVIATVEDGEITAVSDGIATITARCGELTAACRVIVRNPLSGIVLNHTEAEMIVGDTFTLTAAPNEGAELGELTWTSDDENVAQVENGVVTAIGAGQATITVRSGEASAFCVVTVYAPLTAIAFEQPQRTLCVGDSMILTVQPNEGAKLGEVTWRSSAPAIVRVEESGEITAIAAGAATITASCGDLTASCTVVSKIPVTIGDHSGDVYVGDTLNLAYQYHVSEIEALESAVWSVDDPTVATVDPATGVLTGVRAGNVRVTVTCHGVNGGVYTASTDVSVHTSLTGIRLNKTSLYMEIGDEETLIATLLPAGATGAITWITTNPAVVAVSTTGDLTAMGNGTATIIAGCGPYTASCTVNVMIAPEAVDMYSDSMVLTPGQLGAIRYKIRPTNATNKTIRWSSSNSAVATISESGVVTGVKAGECVITGVTVNGLTVTMPVRVVASGQSVTGMRLNTTSQTLGRGGRFQMKATVSPASAVDKSIVWVSANPEIASVDENGWLTGISQGTTTIMAVASSGIYTSARVTVAPVAVTKITLNKTSATAYSGATLQLTASVTPTYADNAAITWSSSNSAVATVNANGLVTGQKKGTAYIYAKAANGKSARCKVTVKPISPVMSISKLSLAAEETYKVNVRFSAETTQDMGLTWTTSNSKVATVDAQGVITATGKGSAKITVKTKYGTSDYLTVTVKAPSPVMNLTKKTIASGDSFTIQVTASPATDKDLGLVWTSSKPSVATVNENGVVTGVKSGSAKITVKTKYGTTDTMTVSVKAVTPVMSATKVSLAAEETYQVNVRYNPTTLQDMELVWTTSNAKVATVDANGVITATGKGSAKIYCTTKYGAKDYLTVTVKAPVPVMNVTKLNLAAEETYQVQLKYSPATDKDTGATWTSSNAKVATVDANGVITATGQGKAKITVKTKYGTSDYLTVTVKAPVPVLNVSKATIGSGGGTYQLRVTKYTPATNNDIALTWSSSKPSVATVDANGLVTGVKAGSAKITVRTEYGTTDTVSITVKASVPVMDRSSHTMRVGDTFTIPVKFNPDGANLPLQWSTSKNSVATVNAEGLITAIGVGTCTITCKTAEGKKDTCKLTVKAMPVSQVQLSNPYGDLAVGGKYTMTAVCLPKQAADAVTWSSSNAAVASVNASTGEITAKAAGTVDIIATAMDGSGVRGSISVNVKAITINAFSLDVSEARVEAGSTHQVNMTLDAELDTVQPYWSSENSLVATVDSNGLITGVGSGITTIRCQVGGQSRTVKVTVPVVNGNFRVLIAGEYTNPNVAAYSSFITNGLIGVDNAFDLANVYGDRYQTARLNNPKKAELLSKIDSFFGSADEGDVSVLYLMSHGRRLNGTYNWMIAGTNGNKYSDDDYITEAELTSHLERIDGEVLLVLVSCYSGQYLQEYATSEAADSLNGVITNINGSRPGGKINIITSQVHDSNAPYTDFPASESYEFFATTFNYALGWDQVNGVALDHLPADADGNGVVSVLELAQYLETHVPQNLQNHINQYGSDSINNNPHQSVYYYLPTPDTSISGRHTTTHTMV